ncbi:MAG: TPM domain-containing protein [Bacteriovoracia bacterium]
MILNKAEEQKLIEKIASIERVTAVEIRIHLCSKSPSSDDMKEAEKVFKKLGMGRLANHAGILIYLAEDRHALVCLGDTAVNEKFGEHFWKEIVDEQILCFKKGDYFIGLLGALERIEKKSIEFFPAEPDEKKDNLLSDEISR